jgi:DnaK suppressor protein
MDLEHFRQLLLAKEKELLGDLAHASAETREEFDPGGQDEMDSAVQSEAKDLWMDRQSHEVDLLAQVWAALRRIADGSYGACQYCGEPIGAKRLEAVPWAAFDVRHQELQDREGLS